MFILKQRIELILDPKVLSKHVGSILFLLLLSVDSSLHWNEQHPVLCEHNLVDLKVTNEMTF
jgi:hypothetical protein